MLQSSRHVELRLGGVADSDRPVLLFETGLTVRYYLPKLDVRMKLLHLKNTVTTCPHKDATTRYWTIEVGSKKLEDAAWCYEQPRPEALGIAGRIGFYDEKLVLLLEDESGARP